MQERSRSTLTSNECPRYYRFLITVGRGDQQQGVLYLICRIQADDGDDREVRVLSGLQGLSLKPLYVFIEIM